MKQTNQEEASRLLLLMQHADQHLDKVVEGLNQAQIDGSKERTQYFEKLSIGSAAAIAATVSFIGTHSSHLQPAWILRCSLIALVVAMTSGIYRNLRYPNYVIAVHNRMWIEAMRDQQRCKNNFFQADRSVHSWQSGEPIDLQEWSAKFEQSDSDLDKLVKEKIKNENSLLTEFKIAEYVCLSFISIAMMTLVWLALRNF